MKSLTRKFLFMTLLIGVPQLAIASSSINQLSHLCIVNLSGKDITHTKVSEIGKKDWKGRKFSPSYNFKDAQIKANGSLCKRQIMRTTKDTAVYKMEFTFSNGEKLRFSNDQKQSAAEYNRIYNHDVTGSATQHMELYQASGYGTNAMYIRPKAKPDNSNWMGKLLEKKPNVKLNKLTMLGSHDAGMYTTENCYIAKSKFITPELLEQATKTQKLSMLQQLQAGARYFDLRVYYDGSSYRMGHFSPIAGCHGAHLDDVLSQVNAFITGKKETVILTFSHTMQDSHNSTKTQHEVVDKTVSKVKEVLKNNLYKYDGSINLAQTELKQVSGKVIAVFDDEFGQHRKSADGLFSYSNLDVYDKYSEINSLHTMKRDQLLKLKNNGGWNKDRLFLLSWTLTPKPELDLKESKLPKLNVQTLSNTANPWLPQTLAEIKAGTLYVDNTQVTQKPNIVYIDFLDPYVGKAVIDFNF